MNPSFSIIIPTHNRPERLHRAVASVCAQTFADWELIIVDDGSFPPIQPTWGQEYTAQILLLHQANAGPAAARRRGVSHAKGDLLCFLDDDDLYLPEHLSTLARARQHLPKWGTVLVAGMITETVTGERSNAPLFLNDRPPLVQYWNRPTNLLPFAIPGEVVRAVPPPLHHSPIEDFEWLVQIISHFPIRQLPEYTAVYVEHEANRTNSLLDTDSLAAREKVLYRLLRMPLVAAAISVRDFRNQLAHQRLHWTRQCIRSRQWKNVRYGLSVSCRSVTTAAKREYFYTLLVLVRTLLKRGKQPS